MNCIAQVHGAPFFVYAHVGRHPLMPPRITGEKRRSGEGAAPYAKSERYTLVCTGFSRLSGKSGLFFA